VGAYFVDSSSLVKRYVQETGTAWVRGLMHRRAGHPILIARITVVELTSAVARRRGGRTITRAQASSFLSQFRKHVAGRYTILEVTPGLLAEAATLANRDELRAYDAVQLAALEIFGQRREMPRLFQMAAVAPTMKQTPQAA
jgi:hypothetical protein